MPGMSYIEHQEDIRCRSCGALNRVIYKYSGFGPANQERETGECGKCGLAIANAKCFSIITKLIDGPPSEAQ